MADCAAALLNSLAMASNAKPLFNAAVRAVLSGPGWRAWWPSHPPWPPTDGETCEQLFNVNDGAILRTFRHHERGVYSLALLPDGLRFVSSSHDRTARIVYHGLAPVSP